MCEGVEMEFQNEAMNEIMILIALGTRCISKLLMLQTNVIRVEIIEHCAHGPLLMLCSLPAMVMGCNKRPRKYSLVLISK